MGCKRLGRAALATIVTLRQLGSAAPLALMPWVAVPR